MSTVPSTGAVLSTLVGVTWKRLFRGRALWICAGIGLLPALFAFVAKSANDAGAIQLVVTAILSSVFVASSIGEEIEEKTITYLWSRPLPRWTVIAGKIMALAPFSIAITLVGWFIAVEVAAGKLPETNTVIAFTFDALATSMVAAGIGTLVPRQGMALAIIYLVILDIAIGVIPASIHEIAVSYQVVMLAGFEPGGNITHSAIALVIIGAVWLTFGMLRIRRLES